jgi:AmiR/NasT family two-component response regulator
MEPVVHQAVGIFMERLDCSASDAFDTLDRAADEQGRSILNFAERVVRAQGS